MNFAENFERIEEDFIGELENMMVSQLIENGRVTVTDKKEDILEFAGRTNFKIRVKRPNKNVWSIPVQLLKDAIRKVLREGKIGEKGNLYTTGKSGRPSPLENPIRMLLRSIPDEEFKKRSFVGNPVRHETYGNGQIKRITETGNVEIQFEEKVALLKPGYFQFRD